MSRFSKAEAIRRGWQFVADKPEEVVSSDGDPQGRIRVIPRSLIAEKWHSPPGRAGGFVREEGATMGLLLERIHSWECHQESFETEEEPVSSDQGLAREKEDAEKAEVDPGPTVQLSFDTHDSLDSPGQSSGGNLVVHKGEKDGAEISKRRDEEAHSFENERVLNEQELKIINKLEEEGALPPEK